MTAITAQILTPWSGSGTNDEPYCPAVAAAYPLMAWVDVTSNNPPTDPDLLVIQASLDAETLAAIENDPAFYVLWSD